MIGFGELRRLATQWRTDLATVERAYASTRLVQGLFAHAALSRALVLRASAALRYAHCADYPSLADPECALLEPRDIAVEFEEAIRAASVEGIAFKLAAFERGIARIEFVGPLGRRSAAQPRIPLTIIASTLRLPAVRVPLRAPFSDRRDMLVTAIALEELLAERVALFASSPRARDVFDVWFALTHASVDRIAVVALAHAIAADKHLAPPQTLVLRRAALVRVWDKALRDVPARPSFDQVVDEIERELKI